MNEKREKLFVYALPHKKKRISNLAKMMGYSVSALFNKAFDDLYEKKKEEFKDWIIDSTPTSSTD